MTLTEMQVLAHELDKLQRTKNDGRGVMCVRSVIAYLYKGDFESAKTVRELESDKIAQYSDIDEHLNSKGLPGIYKESENGDS